MTANGIYIAGAEAEENIITNSVLGFHSLNAEQSDLTQVKRF